MSFSQAKQSKLVLLAMLLALMGLGFASVVRSDAAPTDVLGNDVEEIVIEARQFAYSPAEIKVAQGQRVRIVLAAMDVTHGLYVDGYDISTRAKPGQPSQLEFVASNVGTFRLRCTQTCGTLHPFMVGKLTVAGNQTFDIATFASVSILLFSLTYLWTGFSQLRLVENFSSRAVKTTVRRDLSQVPLLGDFLRWRGFQFALMLPFLIFLMLVLVAGLLGNPVGSHNLSIVLTWIVWWPLVTILLIPLGGRIWCGMCPIPGPGEWLQRFAFIRKREGPLFTLGKRWPTKLRNMWLQNVTFLAIAIFSALIITTPSFTAAVLGSFFVIALILSLIYRDRTFCRYVCPLGGFIGLCSMVAPLAVRVKDKQVCLSHIGKECIKGCATGHGCPWFEYPGTMDRNTYCGLCMECMKTCPKNNVAVGFHRPGDDLMVGNGRADEAFRTFIALGSLGFYVAVMQEPWGWLRSLVQNPWSHGFAIYAAILLGVTVVAAPMLFIGTTFLSRLAAGNVVIPVGQFWRRLSYGLVPLAVTGWIAFSISLILVNLHYLVSVISDPLGHGWNLVGTAGFEGNPLFTAWLPHLQAAILLVGLGWSLNVTWRICLQMFQERKPAFRAFVPAGIFGLGVTLTLLWLFVG